MKYLLFGKDKNLINEELKTIKEKHQINDLSISKHTLVNIDDIIEDMLTISMFSQTKFIIIENADSFTSTQNNVDINKLEQIINYKNEDIIIVFICNTEKLDNRKKITKLAQKTMKIIECNKIKNIYEYIRFNLEEHQMDNESIDFLINRVGDNIGTIKNEIEKLKLYKDKELLINKEDIEIVTKERISSDLFELIDKIIKKDKKNALKIYSQLKLNNEEPIKIIITLANQIRLIYLTKNLIKDGYSEYEISQKLEIHPYRVKLAYINSKDYADEILINNLKKLTNLDYKIKTGQINKHIVLEHYILNL